MKRFTETAKWRDPWFRRLTKESKLLWIWLCDNCDHAGVIDLDLEAASFDIGQTIKPEHVTAIQSRLEKLTDNKFWIKSFIPFQYGTLSRLSRPHDPVFRALEHHKISPDPFLHSQKNASLAKNSQGVAEGVAEAPSGSPPATPKDKDKDKEEDKDSYQEGGMGEELALGNGGPVNHASRVMIVPEDESQRWLQEINAAGNDYTPEEFKSAFLWLQSVGWAPGGRLYSNRKAALEKAMFNERERNKSNGPNQKHGRRDNDRNAGTYNEGKAALYANAATKGVRVDS